MSFCPEKYSAPMAARSLFLTLTRNGRGDKRFRFRSISSSIEAVNQDSITTAHAEAVDDFPQEEEKDDLKSRIFRLRLPKRSVTNVLEKWVSEGREITISDLRSISRDLRRSHRYKHALEISEWMISRNLNQLSDSDFAIRINLITRVFGIDAAERYFDGLPPSSKTSDTYTALLHSYATQNLTEKADHLYERIKKSNLTLTALTFNELMTLYISVGHLEKVPSVIEDMKTLNVARDLFTYNLLVSSCAALLKIDDAERILDEMSDDSGSDETWVRYEKLARIYIMAGGLENSNSGFGSLVEIEKGVVTQRELISYDFLVILYGGLGDKDRVDQIWQSLRKTRQKMTGRNYVCVLSSYVMLGDLREAGKIVDQWKQCTSSEFSLDLCWKVVKGFEKVGMEEKADGFRVVLIEKGCEPLDELR